MERQLPLFPGSDSSRDTQYINSDDPRDWAFFALREYRRRFRLLRGFYTLVVKAVCDLIDTKREGKLQVKKQFRSLRLSKEEIEFLDHERFMSLEFTLSIVATLLWDDIEYLAFRYLGDWLEHNWETLSKGDLGAVKIRDGERKRSLSEFFGQEEYFSLLDAAEAIASVIDYRSYHGAERLARIVGISGVRISFTPELQRDLAELEELRHTFTHRQGWPGIRFNKFDPHAGEAFGVVHFSPEDMGRYVSAVAIFINTFDRALRKSYGRPI